MRRLPYLALPGLFVLGSCTMANPAFGIGDEIADATSDGTGDSGDGDGESGSESADGDGDGESDAETAGDSTGDDGSPSCGDGVVDMGEQCDLGRANDDWGECTRVCEHATCGDGFVQTVIGEACDLGGENGQGGPCRGDCQENVCGDGYLGPGESCEQELDPDCLNCTLASCGNGQIDPNEQCDDGNQINTDECTAACTEGTCGDSFIQEGAEECDDGNALNDDECLANCVPAGCGDNEIWAGVEECDGDNLGGMVCSDFDMLVGELSCSECEFDLSSCQMCAGIGDPCETDDDCCPNGLPGSCLDSECIGL